MARRPSFSVAAIVVTLLAGLGFVSKLARPLIPTPTHNDIGQSPGDFLAQASTQRIDWRPLEPDAFSDARRLDRPVLLVVGIAASYSGRDMDRNVFSAAEVQNYLSRNFVSVRVDGDLAPQWLAGLLPLSRGELGVRPDHQMWVLEPSGRLIDLLSRFKSGSRYDRSAFLKELIRVRRTYAELRERGGQSETAERHANDVGLLATVGESLPDFNAYGARLASEIGPAGGFPQFGYQAPRPLALRYLLLTGQRALADQALDPMLRSPLHDLVDGGFFRGARKPNFREVEFDKPSDVNAEMVAMLALIPSSQTSDAMLSAANRFVREMRKTGFVETARLGDEDAAGRSARTSLSPKRMRQVFPNSTERGTVRRAFGLFVESNPQMIPFVAQPDLATPELVVRLRAGSGPERRGSGGFLMSSNATVSARLAEAARISGDRRLADEASQLFDRLDALRSGNEVPHDLGDRGNAREYLGDYLAFADAALQDYLSLGRVPSFEAGHQVLLRALEVFQGRTPGEFRTGPEIRGGLLPSDAMNPQILDDGGESTTAALIRLCSSYGRLLIGEGDEGLRLLRTAQAATGQFVRFAPELGFLAAGYGCAAASMADDRFAVAVGPDCVALAEAMSKARPTRLVAAAIGSVRRDLQARAPGLYILDRGVPAGPFSVSQAAARLPAVLDVGRG